MTVHMICGQYLWELPPVSLVILFRSREKATVFFTFTFGYNALYSGSARPAEQASFRGLLSQIRTRKTAPKHDVFTPYFTMSHRNESSGVTECLIDFSTKNDSKSAEPEKDSSKELNSKGAGLKETGLKEDPKRAGSSEGSLKGADLSRGDLKGAASKGPDLNLDIAGLNVADQVFGSDPKIADRTGAGLGGEGSKGAYSDAMGANKSRGLAGSNSSASNEAASSGTSSKGASPSQTSGKRKLSQTSYSESWSRGSSLNPGEKLKREPECHMELDKLYPSLNHTVLIDTNEFHRMSANKVLDCKFVPYKGQHVWDNLHVKLPINYPKNGPVSRWDVTVNALQDLTRGKASVKDVEHSIMMYNHAYRNQWRFDALKNYVQQHKPEDNFSTLISKIAKLALQLPNCIQQAIPLLKQNHNHAITLSQVQISCLLANAFFCTFPHRNSTKPNSEYASFPTINFNSLFGEPSPRKIQKLRALFHYFNTVTEEETKPSGLVTFERICIAPHKLPEWKTQTEMLTNLHVSAEGSIDREGKGLLQVDFAAKYIGGGVLGRGLVQEEISFLLCPELIVARLITEKLGDNECLKITGAQTYSLSSGYSDSFKWLGPNIDETGRDKWKRRYCQVVAIDALHFRNPLEQYTRENVKRELNKAYVGFRGDPKIPLDFTPDIATGNWGCGAFNGDPRLKALIQMMAAAVAGRNLAYFTFGNKNQAHELHHVHDFLKTNRVSVGHLYTLLMRYCDEKHKSRNVFEYIREKTGSSSSHL